MTTENISAVISDQFPSFVREDYTTFLQFVKAYYDFLEQNYPSDIAELGGVDSTLDTLVDQFKKQFNLDFNTHDGINDRVLLKHIKEFYQLKGSEEAFRIFFKLLFNENVSFAYPSREMLTVSGGKWDESYSMLVKVITATNGINSPVGKKIYVDKPGKIVEIEVYDCVDITSGGDPYTTYKLSVQEDYSKSIEVNDLVYNNDKTFIARILPSIVSAEIVSKGNAFKKDQIYTLTGASGTGTKIKVKDVGTTTTIPFNNNARIIRDIQIVPPKYDYFKTKILTQLVGGVNYNSNILLHTPFPTATGKVDRVDVLSSGGGYTAIPPVYVGRPFLGGTSVSSADHIVVENRLYLVTTAGTLGTTAPTHTSGVVTSGDAKLYYIGTPATASAICMVTSATIALTGTGYISGDIVKVRPTFSAITVQSVFPSTPGTGYSVGDILTINFGTNGTNPTFRVSAVSATGEVRALTIEDPGTIRTLATSNLKDFATTVVSAAGTPSGCKIDVTGTINKSYPLGVGNTDILLKISASPSGSALTIVDPGAISRLDITSLDGVAVDPVKTANSNVSGMTVNIRLGVKQIVLNTGGVGYQWPNTKYNYMTESYNIGATAFVGTPWVYSGTVATNSQLVYSNRLYTVTTGGTLGTTPPSHTSGSATNGTATLAYAGAASIANSFQQYPASGISAVYVNSLYNSSPTNSGWGSGFLSVPKIRFIGGGGSGAEAVVALRAVSGTISYGGVPGFATFVVGDLLEPLNRTDISSISTDTMPIFRVTSVSSGVITGVSLYTSGYITKTSSTYTGLNVGFRKPGTFQYCNIDLSLGVAKIDVTNAGSGYTSTPRAELYGYTQSVFYPAVLPSNIDVRIGPSHGLVDGDYIASSSIATTINSVKSELEYNIKAYVEVAKSTSTAFEYVSIDTRVQPFSFLITVNDGTLSNVSCPGKFGYLECENHELSYGDKIYFTDPKGAMGLGFRLKTYGYYTVVGPITSNTFCLAAQQETDESLNYTYAHQHLIGSVDLGDSSLVFPGAVYKSNFSAYRPGSIRLVEYGYLTVGSETLVGFGRFPLYTWTNGTDYTATTGDGIVYNRALASPNNKLELQTLADFKFNAVYPGNLEIQQMYPDTNWANLSSAYGSYFASSGLGNTDNGNSSVLGVVVTNSGSGYTSVPTVSIFSRRGTGATAVAVMESEGVTIVNPGSGYTSNDKVTFSMPGSTVPIYYKVNTVDGSGAVTAIMNSYSGEVYSIPYTPTQLANMALTGGTGTGLVVSVKFRLKFIKVTNQGYGYTTTTLPVVSLSGGNPTTAATLGSVIVKSTDIRLKIKNHGLNTGSKITYRSPEASSTDTMQVKLYNNFSSLPENTGVRVPDHVVFKKDHGLVDGMLVYFSSTNGGVLVSDKGGISQSSYNADEAKLVYNCYKVTNANKNWFQLTTGRPTSFWGNPNTYNGSPYTGTGTITFTSSTTNTLTVLRDLAALNSFSNKEEFFVEGQVLFVGKVSNDVIELSRDTGSKIALSTYGYSISEPASIGFGNINLESYKTTLNSFEFIEHGKGYTGDFQATITPLTSDDPNPENAILNVKTGPITKLPGQFDSYESSFVSGSEAIQDSKYYQNYSYVIKSSLPFDEYSQLIKKYVHPAGFEVFGENEINNSIESSPNADIMVSSRLESQSGYTSSTDPYRFGISFSKVSGS